VKPQNPKTQELPTDVAFSLKIMSCSPRDKTG